MPINRLRNILLIICQIVILVCCAVILAQPAMITKSQITVEEVVAIIDSSASMRTTINGETRFERAVAMAQEKTDTVLDQGGIVSVLLAENTPSFLAQRITADSKKQMDESLKSLLENDACSYGQSNIDESMALCENVITENPAAKVYLYTDIKYSYIPDGITVVDVTDDNEWNAAILNAYVTMEDNYYSIYVEIACYGRDAQITLDVDVNYPNSGYDGDKIKLTTNVNCDSDTTKTVIFRNESAGIEDYEQNAKNIVFSFIDDSQKFYSFDYIHISLGGGDNFDEDDNFDIYNGEKHVLKVQYASLIPNDMFYGALDDVNDYYRTTKNVWDIQITEVDLRLAEAATSGFDVYIFEHMMPSVMPTDGVVFLCDPDITPTGAGFTLGSIKDYNKESINLNRESNSALLNYMDVESMTISRFTDIVSYDPAYEVLASCDTKPVILAKNDGDSKVIVCAFSVHYSNEGIRPELALLMLNAFEYYIPATVVSNRFEIYQSISLQAQGKSLTVSNVSEAFTEFPATLYLSLPGTYTITQVTDFGKTIEDRIYVTIPTAECNIWGTADTLRDPYLIDVDTNYFQDMITYVAAALLLLLFVEWLLQAKDNL
jgi:hypothetical protein